MADVLNNKILTVTVAAYNAEEYLREVLDSFVGLRNMDMLEVFVVDDGGKDSSLDIAKEYEARFPGIYHAVHKENGGWGSTVNYSMRHASGKYFKILDGDDYYDKENTADLIDYLAKCDSDIVITPYATFEDGSYRVLNVITPDSAYEEGKVYKLTEADKPFPLAMHSFTVKTRLLQDNDVQLKERCLYRDMEFTCKALTYGETIMFFNRPIYYYRLGREGQSVSKSSYIKHIDEHADIVYDILSASRLPQNLNKRNLIYRLASEACTHQYNIYFYTSKTPEVKRKLIEYDNKIKAYPTFYKGLNIPVYIKALTKTGCMGYKPVMSLLYVKRKALG